MDPKGKGIVINDKEKESFVNEPKDDKRTDSGSGHRRKDGRKKKTRCIRRSSTTTTVMSPLLPIRTTTTMTTTNERRLIQTFLSIIRVFLKVQIHIYFPFLSASLHTLMGRTTDFGVTKCVVICSLSTKHMGDCLEWNEV
jgi:hypothetical protein